MLFNDPLYCIFLFFVFCIYWLFSKRIQNIILLASSYLFYGLWEYKFLLLILICSLSAYYTASLLIIVRSNIVKKYILLVGILINFSFLVYFKYFNFFVSSFKSILNSIGFHLGSFSTFEILLPVGISFFTFQAATFIVDVYRGEIEQIPSLVDFLLYISFFPQLVAGPIERAGKMLPQILKRRCFDKEKAEEGIILIAYGLFKKSLVADTLSVYVDSWYGQIPSTQGGLLALGTLFFSIQIYCDFSGYSDIARGSARLLGFELSENFNFPYFSKSPAEFWRRWHMTLMSWFKDYLYIPMGGSRCGEMRKYLNIFAVFFVSGLWHGANWSYVLWGGYNGILVVIHSLISTHIKNVKKRDRRPVILLNIIFLNFFVMVSWIFFRSSSVGESFEVLKKVFYIKNYSSIDVSLILKPILILALFLIIEAIIFHSRQTEEKLLKSSYIYGVSFAIITLTIIFGTFSNKPFIYFQF